MIFRIFEDCVLVSGPTKSTLCDFSNGRIIEITNNLFEILNVVNYSETISDAAEKLDINKNTLYKELEKLNNNYNIGFFTENPNIIKQIRPFQLNNDVKTISNIIVEISEEMLKLLDSILLDVDLQGCYAMEIRIMDAYSFNNIQQFIDKIEASNIEYLEICVLNGAELNTIKFIQKLENYSFIQRITFFNISSIQNIQNFFEDNKIPFDIGFRDYEFDNYSCGIIDKTYFTCNKFNLYENKFKNSCLNRKVAIDKNGNIKSCPHIKESIGNIKKTSFNDIINNEVLLKYWNISKDQVKICKDCEYRMVCSDCRAHTIDKTLFGKPKNCKYNPYTGKWLPLLLLFFVVFFNSCSPKISRFTTGNYNTQFSIFVNKDIGILNRLSADYRECDLSKIDLSKTPLKKSEFKKVFGCAITHTPPTFAWISFIYKKEIKNTLTPEEVQNFNFPDQKYYIVKEKNKVNGNQLYSIYIDLGNTKKPWLNRLPYESLKNEVYTIYKGRRKCISASDLSYASLNKNIYQTIAFYRITQIFSDSIKFCNKFAKGIFYSLDNQYNALTKFNNDSIIMDYAKIFNLISNYNVVLVKDNHSSSVEDIFLKQMIIKSPSFFNKVFLESLSSKDSINRRGFPITSSGFYFLNYFYRALAKSCLDRNIPLFSYDYLDPNCSFGVHCNEIRDSMQAVNIMNKTKPNERNVVFSGGSHSKLSCNSSYKYMGCFLCKKNINVAQISLTDGVVTIKNCNGVIAKLKYGLVPKAWPIRYVIHKNKPCIIALYSKNEYLQYKEKAIAKYIFFVLPNKKYKYQVNKGHYIEIIYDLFGNIIRKHELYIE